MLRLTLNRPGQLNAVNEGVHLGLRDGFERARADAGIRACS